MQGDRHTTERHRAIYLYTVTSLVWSRSSYVQRVVCNLYSHPQSRRAVRHRKSRTGRFKCYIYTCETIL